MMHGSKLRSRLSDWQKAHLSEYQYRSAISAELTHAIGFLLHLSEIDTVAMREMQSRGCNRSRKVCFREGEADIKIKRRLIRL
jgi:hypothetical protein